MLSCVYFFSVGTLTCTIGKSGRERTAGNDRMLMNTPTEIYACNESILHVDCARLDPCCPYHQSDGIIPDT